MQRCLLQRYIVKIGLKNELEELEKLKILMELSYVILTWVYWDLLRKYLNTPGEFFSSFSSLQRHMNL